MLIELFENEKPYMKYFTENVFRDSSVRCLLYVVHNFSELKID